MIATTALVSYATSHGGILPPETKNNCFSDIRDELRADYCAGKEDAECSLTKYARNFLPTGDCLTGAMYAHVGEYN